MVEYRCAPKPGYQVTQTLNVASRYRYGPTSFLSPTGTGTGTGTIFVGQAPNTHEYNVLHRPRSVHLFSMAMNMHMHSMRSEVLKLVCAADSYALQMTGKNLESFRIDL